MLRPNEELFILAISRRDTFARKPSDREDIFNGHAKNLCFISTHYYLLYIHRWAVNKLKRYQLIN
jgi:hypothetical protein